MPDFDLEAYYSDRADKLADAFRTLTVTLATSGIGLLASKYLSLDPDNEARLSIRLAIASLSLSLIVLGIGLQLQKKKALTRRDMVRATRLELRNADERHLADELLRRHMRMFKALDTPWFRNELYDALGFYGIVAAASYLVIPIEPALLTLWIIGGFVVLAAILNLMRESLRRVQRKAAVSAHTSASSIQQQSGGGEVGT